MNTTNINFSLEQRIVHHLILQSNSISDLGLYNGKMAIIITLYHHAKNIKSEAIQDIAGGILEELWREVHEDVPLNFESGLLGIAWGIEWLIQNKFVEGESLEICGDIDKIIMEKDPRRITDISIETGLCGLLHYVLIHIQNCITQKTNLPFDNTYLSDLYVGINNIALPTYTNNEGFILLKEIYNLFYINKEPPKYSTSFYGFIEMIELNEDNIISAPLGIKKGLGTILLIK